MNRRTVLRSAGVGALVGLAGCVDGVREHFTGSVQGIVPIEVHSEADRTYNLLLESHERETDRRSYEQSFSVTPNETVQPQHLRAVDQSFKAVRFDENDERSDVRAAPVTAETDLVLIRVYDDDLVIELHRDDAEEPEIIDGDETDTSEGGTEPENGSAESGDAAPENDSDETDDTESENGSAETDDDSSDSTDG